MRLWYSGVGFVVGEDLCARRVGGHVKFGRAPGWVSLGILLKYPQKWPRVAIKTYYPMAQSGLKTYYDPPTEENPRKAQSGPPLERHILGFLLGVGRTGGGWGGIIWGDW
jgi:hypothetical protein